jgi:Putative zinc-finger
MTPTKTPTLNDFQLMVLEKHTIDCVDVVELLGDLVEGDLTPTLAARLESHIEDCNYCGEIKRGYEMTIELARDLKNEEKPVPTAVQNRLRSALNEKLGINLGMVG